jgi:hypothetical protein
MVKDEGRLGFARIMAPVSAALCAVDVIGQQWTWATAWAGLAIVLTLIGYRESRRPGKM